MNILQINACHYRRGGSETVYFNTAKILTDHGHNVAFFSSMDYRNEPSDYEEFFVHQDNIRKLSFFHKIKKVPGYLYNNEASHKLELLLKTFKPDIAHVHLFYSVLSVSVLRTLKKHKIPVVHTVHDYRLLCPVDTFLTKDNQLCESCKGGRFYNCLIKRCSEGKLSQSAIVMLEAYFWKFFVNPVNNIDHIIYVSKFIRQKHIEFNSRFNTKNSQLYNFNFLRKDKNNYLKGDYFFYYGRLSPEKGIEFLLDVFNNTDYKLKIAGTGPLSESVEEAVSTNPNIEYVGFQTGDILTSLIKNAFFVIVPSMTYENNPMTIIESFSAGKPVIGSRIGGIPELIQHGRNGYLFNYGDKISFKQILDKAVQLNSDEYREFSVAAEVFAKENFEPEKHYNDLMQVFKKVLEETSTANRG